MKTLLTIGKAYLDINCTAFPFDANGLAVESETVGSDYNLAAGGSALNFARMCRKLDLNARFVGKVGNDELGALLPELLAKAGIQNDLIVDPAASTVAGMNFINPDGETIMMVAGTASDHMTAEEVERTVQPLLAEINYLYFGSCFKLGHLLPAFLKLAKNTGPATKIIVDHGRIPGNASPQLCESLQALVGCADYYFPSLAEFKQLWQVPSAENGLRLMRGRTKATVVVKQSKDGALSLHNDTIVHVPSFAVSVLNTAGAGDSFNAGFIAAQEQQLDLVASMRYACAVAALKVSQPELPDTATVQRLLAA